MLNPNYSPVYFCLPFQFSQLHKRTIYLFLTFADIPEDKQLHRLFTCLPVSPNSSYQLPEFTCSSNSSTVVETTNLTCLYVIKLFPCLSLSSFPISSSSQAHNLPFFSPWHIYLKTSHYIGSSLVYLSLPVLPINSRHLPVYLIPAIWLKRQI